MKKIINKQFGWRPALPDVRDYVLTMTTTAEKDSVDGRDECSPVIDQGDLGSCTGQALVYLLERLQRKMFDRHTDLSALFSYYTGRYEMGEFGDVGCTLRDVMKAAVKFGICPEKDWPYDIKLFDEEPPILAAASAAVFRPKAYYRLDPPGAEKKSILNNALHLLAAGYSLIAGFSVFSSINDGPDIPFPSDNDSVLGGHAIHIIGFNKNRMHRLVNSGTGAFQIQNTWGDDWGDGGYGWLPFEYLFRGLMSDLWTAELLAAPDLGIFG